MGGSNPKQTPAEKNFRKKNVGQPYVYKNKKKNPKGPGGGGGGVRRWKKDKRSTTNIQSGMRECWKKNGIVQKTRKGEPLTERAKVVEDETRKKGRKAA